MNYPCIECTLDIAFGRRTVRLWLARPNVPQDVEMPLYLVQHVRRKMATNPEHGELLHWCAELAGVNAVQIIEQTEWDPDVRFGSMVYTVEF